MLFNSGKAAEDTAAGYLAANGFRILQRNWKTRYCEIDIVARRDETVYFVEVKFRQGKDQGSALEYVTGSKLRQMQTAARYWVSANDWRGDIELSAVGIDADVITFIPSLDY